MEPPRMPTPGERPRNLPRTARRLFQFVGHGARGALWALFAVTLAAIALDLVLPLLIEGCINQLASGPAGGRFFHWFSALLAVICLSALLGYFHEILAGRFSLQLEAALRQEFFQKILRVPLRESERYQPGDLMSRVMNDANLAAGAFSQAVLTLFSNVTVIVGCAVVMLWRNGMLGGVTILATLVSVLLTGLVSRALFPALLEQQTALGILNAHVEDTLRGFRTCVLGGRQAENCRRMNQYSREVCQKSVKAAWIQGLLPPLMLFLGNLNFLLILILGARFVLVGAMGLGTLQAFILYSRQFMEPVSELGECFARVQAAFAGAERIFTLLDCADEPVAGLPTTNQSPAIGTPAYLQLADVCFSYQGRRPVLRGIHLTVQRGERLAIVGETGAGKTTLVSLLPLLYCDYTGTITLEGREIRQIGPAALRRNITVVPQEPVILAGTVLENLTYGVEAAEPERVYRAAEAMGLDAVIRTLPAGYGTLLGGAEPPLSQGQLQLLCLARALLRDSGLLILDESTSSVDPATELALKRGTAALTAGRTSILIAHRLSSVVDADHIGVMRDGVIVEYGTHGALLAQGGYYASLYNS